MVSKSGPAEGPQQPRTSADQVMLGGVVRMLAVMLLFLAAVAATGYAWWAVTRRREIFVRIGEDVDAVPRAAAERNDTFDDLLFWTSVGITVGALVFWVVAKIVDRLIVGALGFAGAALVVVGAGVASGGAYLTALVESVQTADRAVLGYLVVGGGWALIAFGLITGLASVFLARQRPAAGQSPRIGYAAWARR